MCCALIPLLCQSHGDKCFEIPCLLCMSFRYIILFVTIWCKDNKLIIYLFIRAVSPRNHRNKKSHEAMQKLKGSLHTALRGEWQLDYDTPSETSHYYFAIKKGLYGGQYPNPLKSFMNNVPRHAFSKLFQLHTGHDVLGKYFQTRGIKQRKHNCKCSQLETVERVLKECPLHPAERNLLRKVFPELDIKILLDTKKGLDAVARSLDLLPQVLCWQFAWLSSLLRFYWVSISGIDLLGVMYCRFPLTHGVIHGGFGVIEYLNL